jgi:lipooligosaccharide transport system permease protein
LSGGKDFDLMLSTQFALFLFSGTFVPAEAYPAGVRWLVELSPLYQSVSLIRAIAGGTLSWAQVGNVAYLVAATAVGLMIAARRMNTLLRR